MPTSVLPPPLDRHEITSLWVRLPAVNRQRLMWRLSQLLERQLINGDISGEDESMENLGISGPRIGRGAGHARPCACVSEHFPQVWAYLRSYRLYEISDAILSGTHF